MQGERSNRLRQYGAYVILNLHYNMVLTIQADIHQNYYQLASQHLHLKSVRVYNHKMTLQNIKDDAGDYNEYLLVSFVVRYVSTNGS